MKHLPLKYTLTYNLNINHLLMFLASALLICSCKKNLKSDRPTKNKLIVMAEITAGDSATIPVAGSLIAGNGAPVNFQKVNDATAILIAQNGAESHLSLNTSADYTANPAAIYSHPGIFKHSTDYTLNINHAQMGAVTATTRIPAPFAVENVIEEESELYGKNVLKFSFNIQDDGNKKNHYIFEVVKQLAYTSQYFTWQGVRHNYDIPAGEELHERLEDEHGTDIEILMDTITTNKHNRLNLFTSDPKTDNNNIGTLDSSFRRIFITDSLFNGQSYSSSFLISMDQFEARNPEDKGIVKVQIKSVDKSLYKYLLEYEKYKTDFGKMPVGQLGSPTGNIKNGFGIFGGSFKKEWRYYYDDLE